MRLPLLADTVIDRTCFFVLGVMVGAAAVILAVLLVLAGQL